MNTSKYLLILVLAVSTSASLYDEFPRSSKHNRQELLDPWYHTREKCRIELGLSKDQLEALDRTGANDDDYIRCWVTHTGILGTDGTVKKTKLLKLLKDVVPKTLAEPLVNYCLHEVYHAGAPKSHQRYRFWGDFMHCVKSKLSPEMWDLVGSFAAPEYAPLDLCEESY